MKIKCEHEPFTVSYAGKCIEDMDHIVSNADLTGVVRVRRGRQPALCRWLQLTGKAESEACRLYEDIVPAEHLWLCCHAFALSRHHNEFSVTFEQVLHLTQPATGHLISISFILIRLWQHISSSWSLTSRWSRRTARSPKRWTATIQSP